MNRRGFLAQMVLSTLAFLVPWESWVGKNVDDSGSPPSSKKIKGALHLGNADGRGMRHFGRHVVADRSLSIGEAEEALCTHCGVSTPNVLTADQIRAQHRQDVEEGNLVCVDQVYLSESEAKLCAAVYCRGEG